MNFFTKTGLFLGVLALFSWVFIGFAQESSESGKNLFADYDQDGLSNEEETAYGTNPDVSDTDGDGYSDYVELTSGYDPLKPAPGDRILPQQELAVGEGVEKMQDQENNLTEEVASKLAGAVSANVSGDSDLTLADIEKVVQDSVDVSSQVPKLPDVDISRIKIKDQTYTGSSEEERKEKIREDAAKYLSAISYIILLQFPQISSGNNEEDSLALMETSFIGIMQSFISGKSEQIDALAESGKKATEQMFDVEVPESLLEVHIRGIQFAQYAQELKKNITVNPGDPLKSISNLSVAQGFLVSVQAFFSEVEKQFSDLGIEDMLTSVNSDKE